MNWLGRLLRTRRMEQQLDAELRFHFESQVADRMAGGMGEAEARRRTRLEFGGMEQIKQQCRESRGTLWLATIAQDVRFGARILARSPGFSLTAIAVLALGIGVNTLAFSLYDLIVLETVPVRDAESLVSVERRSPENREPGVPWASIAFYREHAKTLSAVMARMDGSPMVLNQDAQRVVPSFVTGNSFGELGASAAAGRLFDPAREDLPGAAPVAVLSYALWQRRFGGDAGIVGKTISLSGRPATVIGVTAQGFANLGMHDPDVWLPLMQYGYFVPGSRPLEDGKFEGLIVMTGRLAPGVSAGQAAQELLALTNQLRPMYPAVIWKDETIQVTPAAHFFQTEDALPLLLVASVLVLLILAVACANLGGLLMARGVSRQREIQIRLSIGASRARIFRQLFTESVLLALVGSLVALPLSSLALRLTLVSANAPAWMLARSAWPDWRVLVFTVGIALVAALFFGLLPTLQMVKAMGRGRAKTRGQQVVICAQVAASCVLLILAGLLVRATLHTLYSDPGFRYEEVLAMDPGLGDHGYTPALAQAYLEQLEARLRTVPGVASVALAAYPPLVNENVRITSIHVDGKQVLIYPNWVGPRFFETMGIPLLRGRYLQAGDRNAVVLSESLARRRWPTEDPIGKQWKDGKDVVVGVVGNTRAMELNNTDGTEIYYPAAADGMPGMSVLIKTVGKPDGLAPEMQSILAGLDPRLYPAITPLKAGFHKSVAQAEQIAGILSLLGGIAIFLAVVGLLGLAAYAVTQRTREIAIRLALGASRVEICVTIVRHFAAPVAVGLALGVGMTAALSQVLRRALYGISGLDPMSYAGALLLLGSVLLVAALIPVRRAFRLDVARILHAE